MNRPLKALTATAHNATAPAAQARVAPTVVLAAVESALPPNLSAWKAELEMGTHSETDHRRSFVQMHSPGQTEER